MKISRTTGYAVTGLLTAVLLWAAAEIRGYNLAEQARFNVDVLEQFIQYDRMIEGRQIENLTDLPDFHLISPTKSLSVRASDIRRKIFGGYVYDMQSSGQGRYVISASPIGFLAPPVEFGVTEKGLLGMNTRDPDVYPDSREEVQHWPWVERETGVRSQALPAYLRDEPCPSGTCGSP